MARGLAQELALVPEWDRHCVGSRWCAEKQTAVTEQRGFHDATLRDVLHHASCVGGALLSSHGHNCFYHQVEAGRKTCVDFRADRWYPVANATIQHMLKVYDYYEPGKFSLVRKLLWNLLKERTKTFVLEFCIPNSQTLTLTLQWENLFEIQMQEERSMQISSNTTAQTTCLPCQKIRLVVFHVSPLFISRYVQLHVIHDVQLVQSTHLSSVRVLPVSVLSVLQLSAVTLATRAQPRPRDTQRMRNTDAHQVRCAHIAPRHMQCPLAYVHQLASTRLCPMKTKRNALLISLKQTKVQFFVFLDKVFVAIIVKSCLCCATTCRHPFLLFLVKYNFYREEIHIWTKPTGFHRSLCAIVLSSVHICISKFWKWGLRDVLQFLLQTWLAVCSVCPSPQKRVSKSFVVCQVQVSSSRLSRNWPGNFFWQFSLFLYSRFCIVCIFLVLQVFSVPVKNVTHAWTVVWMQPTTLCDVESQWGIDGGFWSRSRVRTNSFTQMTSFTWAAIQEFVSFRLSHSCALIVFHVSFFRPSRNGLVESCTCCRHCHCGGPQLALPLRARPPPPGWTRLQPWHDMIMWLARPLRWTSVYLSCDVDNNAFSFFARADERNNLNPAVVFTSEREDLFCNHVPGKDSVEDFIFL